VPPHDTIKDVKATISTKLTFLYSNFLLKIFTYYLCIHGPKNAPKYASGDPKITEGKGTI